MSLKTKLWSWILAGSMGGLVLLISSFLLIGIFFTQGYTLDDLEQIGTRLTEEAEQHGKGLNPDGRIDSIISLMDHYHAQDRQMHFEWISADGTLQFATDPWREESTFEAMMDRFAEMPANLWGYDNDEVTLSFGWEQHGERQYMILSVPSKAMSGTQFYIHAREVWLLLPLLIPLILFCGTPVVFALLFFYRMNGRLTALNQAMLQLNTFESHAMLDDQGKDEIGQLSRHFNDMSGRIRDQVAQIRDNEQKRQTLIANLSHDLRTPLTMIQGYAETLDSGDYQNEEERKRFTKVVLNRSRYMNGLLQNLLEIAHMDMHLDQVLFGQANLSKMLRKLAAEYIPILENHGMSFDIRIPDHPIEAMANAQLMERAVRNLIENAIQYGHKGGYLGVTLHQINDADSDRDKIEILITDYGPGIPVEHQEMIFDRFFRGSDAREGEGLGIGLTIVKDIIYAHQGSVSLISLPRQGTTFMLTLPVLHDYDNSGKSQP